MSALPVIERELRVRARRKSTFWLRVIAALLASLTVASTLSWAQHQTWGPWRPGKTLLDTLSALAFVFCLVEGVRQTADCLSQEKRDGTLGLLFLTDLSGFDVVIGKLTAASLGSFYALLAVFPAMAVALPAGGLTAGEFWRTQLVLLNTLFLGLACGLWASARHREENRSLLAGLKLALGFTALPVVLEIFLHGTRVPSLSPGVAMYLAGDTAYITQPARFWLTLLTIHLLCWTLLALAGRRLSQTWRDDGEEPLNTTEGKIFNEANEGNKSVENFTGPEPPEAVSVESVQPTASSFSSLSSVNENPEPAPQPIESAWPYIDTGTADSPALPRTNTQPAMESDPAAWLAARSPEHKKLLGCSVFVLVLGNLVPGVILMLFAAPVFTGVYSALHWATELVPLLLIALIASRPFTEARRTGAMELLLATPLPPEAITRGQWQFLWSQMRGAARIASLIAGGAFLLSLSAMLSQTGGPSMAAFSLFHFLQCGQRLLCAISVCWLGLYLGLRTRSAMMAVGLNLFWVLVAPWVAGSIFWLVVRLFVPMVFTGGPAWWYWMMTLVWFAIGLAYLWWVIRWTKRKLFTRFRELAAQA